MFNIKDTRAYKYAVKCVNDDSGKTGRYIKKQCAQWLEIADGKDPDCYISAKAYKKVSGILKLMVHPDLNRDMYSSIDDYAMLFIVAVLCTYNRNGGRKYTIALLEIARKNRKTFTSATIFIILMLTEPRFARLFSVAPDYKLSSELRLAVRKIIKVSPLLEKHFKITRDMITCKLTDIEYTPLAYSNDRMDGRLANAFLADEDGAMDSYPVEAMTSSQITLKSKLGIIISTQYPNENNDFLERVDLYDLDDEVNEIAKNDPVFKGFLNTSAAEGLLPAEAYLKYLEMDKDDAKTAWLAAKDNTDNAKQTIADYEDLTMSKYKDDEEPEEDGTKDGEGEGTEETLEERQEAFDAAIADLEKRKKLHKDDLDEDKNYYAEKQEIVDEYSDLEDYTPYQNAYDDVYKYNN